MAKENAINTNLIPEEKEAENNLRPLSFEDYIGQEKIKANLKIYIQAANERNEPIDHVLLYGPPGLGKTTLAGIIANEMGRSMKIVSGPAIEYPGEILAIVKQLPKGGVLFVDEIHRLSKPVEEALYSVMEDFAFDAVIENGEQTTVRRINLDRFTLIGATTRAGLLSAPLRDRFGIVHRMEFYEPEELADIVIRLLDYINMRWGDKYDWWYNPSSFRIPDDFPVAAWKLVKEHLNEGSMNVRDSIQYVLEWAEKLNIDIEQHIKWKMRYNSLRSYKHGGKKY